MCYRLIRPLLFLLPAEWAHSLTLKLWKLLLRVPGLFFLIMRLQKPSSPKLQVQTPHLLFPNPIGLAAGLDKDANYLKPLAALGFGFLEVGTVTPLPQPGNDPPRLFRLPADLALLNRMGFNNQGADVVAQRLQEFYQWKTDKKFPVLIGINIGKNSSTPLDQAVNDYVYCFQRLHKWADYVVINISSPNTEGLRELQHRQRLDRILEAVQQHNSASSVPRPLFVKIAPDLTFAEVDEVVDCTLKHKLAGIIATNTTMSRHNLKTSAVMLEQLGTGGISGRPLAARSTEIVRFIRQRCGNHLTLIACGGVFSTEDVKEKIRAGAQAVQLYTALIYAGPALIRRMLRQLQQGQLS
ncbi:MAG: quinone-dependent dihydroorotate dehydrogenase [Chitinophagales bacterium]|nr:quinone-dependent dihydroorotate dehydrogenase [Chitinophagales bacterium]MDW8427070.1 quinone-dependent dihydroorotate dehydrogenase [Chitinophagales bacterium]